MERPGEETLIRYFLGKCSPEEEKVIAAYLSLKLDQEYVEACLREAFYLQDEGDQLETGGHARDRVWQSLLAKQQNTSESQVKNSRDSQLKRNFWLYRAAATVAFIVFTTGLIFVLTGKHKNNISSSIAWKQFKSETGKLKIITLADHSTITMFPGSSIDVPSNFNSKDRRIKLQGRAFFRIAHNTSKPFYVSAAHLTTRVLGTSFEINSRGAENIITLHTGSISINKENKELIKLRPNQQIHYQENSGKYKINEVDAAGTISWMNGELNYNKAPLGVVMKDIEDWYGVTIHTDHPSILDQKVIFSYSNQPLSRIMLLLSKSAQFSYEINGKEIIIKKGVWQGTKH